MTTEAPSQSDVYSPPSLSALSGRKKKSGGPDQTAAQEVQSGDVPERSSAGQSIGEAGGQSLDDIPDREGEAETPVSRRRPRRAPVQRPDAEQAAELTGVPVSFSVSAGVRRRLDRAQAKELTGGQKRKGHLEFIFEALEAAHEFGWEKVVATAVPEAQPRRFGANRAPKDREFAGTGPEGLYVRMLEEDLLEIDKAADEAKVPDRNKLVAICLNWHLPGRKDKP